MKKFCITHVFLLISFFFFQPIIGEPLPTELRLRGYAVIPTPREVIVGAADIEIDQTWVCCGGKLKNDHIAIDMLTDDLAGFWGLKLSEGTANSRSMRLAVRAETVQTGQTPAIDQQAYFLKIKPDAIEIIGNSDQGLFYGVQTLLQLLKRGTQGQIVVPEIEIRDWPSYELRFLHWDTKNHQDYINTLKNYLDWAARFKVNMISFEVWDKFQFPSHPVIGVPGAFTSRQLQEIVDYGLKRFIQVVPNIQAPAHFQWVLKHPEYAHLRADGSDYQACMCDEETYKLIFSLYEDIIKATRGVDYFHVSSDEVYYSGICIKCDRPYTPENRSLTWVEFVQRAHEFLKNRGRKVLIWAEWPLMPEHVALLPHEIIDGVLGNDYFVGRIPAVTRRQYIEEENRQGIRQLAYTAQTAGLAPMNFRSNWANLKSTFEMISSQAWQGNPIGVFGAAWDDRGPHSEFYWLGWSQVAQYGWTHETPSVAQHVEEFIEIYYGPRVRDIVEIYQGLDKQAGFLERTWDRNVSSVPGLGTTRGSYGYSAGKWDKPRPLRHQTLPLPALPYSAGLDFIPVYVGKYGDWSAEAEGMLRETTALKYQIQANLPRADRNHYNLQVLLSVAEFTRYHDQMLVSMKEIEEKLEIARQAASQGNSTDAVQALLEAHELAAAVFKDRQQTFAYFRSVWGQSRNPENLTRASHFEREESVDLEGWMADLVIVLKGYADAHNIPFEQIQPSP